MGIRALNGTKVRLDIAKTAKSARTLRAEMLPVPRTYTISRARTEESNASSTNDLMILRIIFITPPGSFINVVLSASISQREWLADTAEPRSRVSIPWNSLLQGFGTCMPPLGSEAVLRET
jgi:hypothetical protein